jgi:hypothetical protein
MVLSLWPALTQKYPTMIKNLQIHVKLVHCLKLNIETVLHRQLYYVLIGYRFCHCYFHPGIIFAGRATVYQTASTLMALSLWPNLALKYSTRKKITNPNHITVLN